MSMSTSASMSKSTSMSARPVRVSVLIDLERGPNAGGHVIAWERLARAAAGDDGVDLTLHFSGDDGVERVSDNVRFVSHRPVLSTARFGFLSHIPAHTDLAPYHGRLAAALAESDIIHTTDAYFAFARTAERVAR